MDIICMVLGAILLVVASNAKSEVKGIVKFVGWFALIVGILWFVISFVQSFAITSGLYY